ncbi:MAG: response regulator [Oligoflexia bacterium]|nr:response regulator [Oligoflexia bacterium]
MSTAKAMSTKAVKEPLKSNRILVVDDEKAILQSYLDILSPSKDNVVAIKSSRARAVPHQAAAAGESSDAFDVVAVASGEQAVAEVKKAVKEGRPFAVGFFDVLLGSGIDGIEAVRQIHEADPAMYAVLVTAYQDRHVNSIQKVFGKEFQDRWDYLNKPFTEGEILQKARGMMAAWNLRSHMEYLKQHVSHNDKTMTVSAVARTVSHEFGNVLLQIMGKADLAKNASKIEDMKAALEAILVSSEHAAKVLASFKGMAGSKESKKEKIKISASISDTLLMMDHELKRKSIKVHLSGIEELPEFMGDNSGLIQVFMNLIINAIHAIGDNGGEIFISGSVKDKNIEIKLRDSGMGIKTEPIDKIFESFFTTKGKSGTGLGLSVCKEVVEINHRGKLTVQNSSQGGAEFTMLLPTQGDGEDL